MSTELEKYCSAQSVNSNLNMPDRSIGDLLLGHSSKEPEYWTEEPDGWNAESISLSIRLSSVGARMFGSFQRDVDEEKA